jgi:hypothetical protein
MFSRTSNETGVVAVLLIFGGIFVVGPLSILSVPFLPAVMFFGLLLSLGGAMLSRWHDGKQMNKAWALGILLYYHGTLLMVLARASGYNLPLFLAGLIPCVAATWIIVKDLRREDAERAAANSRTKT